MLWVAGTQTDAAVNVIQVVKDKLEQFLQMGITRLFFHTKLRIWLYLFYLLKLYGSGCSLWDGLNGFNSRLRNLIRSVNDILTSTELLNNALMRHHLHLRGIICKQSTLDTYTRYATPNLVLTLGFIFPLAFNIFILKWQV